MSESKEEIREQHGIEYQIPSHFLPALINGDESGLEESDIKELNTFYEKENFSDGHWDCSDEEYFSRSNDVNNMGGNVVDCWFVKFPKGGK